MFSEGVQNGTIRTMKKRKQIRWGRLLLLLMVPLFLLIMLGVGIQKVFFSKPEVYDPSLFVLEGDRMTYQDPSYETSWGIDVSEHNQIIDWDQVADDGVEFVFVRLGYRGGIEGQLHEDETFSANIQGAREAGLELGVYWYSSAIDQEELQEEIDFVLERLEGIQLDLPVVYDMEIFDADQGRINSLSVEEKTDLALGFCDAMEEAGYESMVYGNYTWLHEHLDHERILDQNIWYAAYQETPDMTENFTIWQYSQTGQVAGIQGNVDLNIRLTKKE